MKVGDAKTTAPIRILVIDDDEEDYFILSELISSIPGKKFQTTWCKDYQSALDAMQKSLHDLYFVDYYLTGNTGLDLLTEAMIDACEAPIIMLTGKGNPSIDKRAMQRGAADYLIKSELTPEKVERCIRYALERGSTLRELKESERQYRNIFEKTNDVIFIADENMRLKNINEAASNIFGYKRNKLLAMDFLDLLASDEDKKWITKKLTQDHRIDDYQAELNTQENENKVGILSASFETDLRGHRYVQGIIHEITLLKRTEEITIQIEKLEAKGKVIRTLAHEVRNPLNNIQLSVANLKTSDAEQLPEYLEIIQRNIKRIDDLINELMDSTRFYKMKLAVVSLQSVMDDAIEVTQDRLNLSKIRLQVKYSPVLAMAMVDKEKMRIAFLNLIINAIEAMEENKGMMTVSVNAHPDFHEVKIEDNGCGMTEAAILQLFEPYYTTKPKGMGLGLATTHAIIVSHKATIRVTSIEGQGSIFTLAFPAM